MPKGYGAAISETLTWGGGSEVPLTEFFLTVYLWANCCKTTFHEINLVFFEIFRAVSHRSLSCCAICLNSSRFGL